MHKLPEVDFHSHCGGCHVAVLQVGTGDNPVLMDEACLQMQPHACGGEDQCAQMRCPHASLRWTLSVGQFLVCCSFQDLEGSTDYWQDCLLKVNAIGLDHLEKIIHTPHNCHEITRSIQKR